MQQVKKLIDRIRDKQTEVEAESEREAARAEQQRIEGDKIQRQNGRASAYDRIPHIDAIILDKVKHSQYVYSEPVLVKHPGTLGPYWEAYTDYLIEHFTFEGLSVRLAKMPIHHGGVIIAMTYTLEFSWLHA